MGNTVKIRKGNKVKYVDAGRLNAYLSQGFEQIDEQGNVLKRATGGSFVPIAKYNQLLEEYEKLKAELEKLKGANKNTSKKAKDDGKQET